VLKRVGERFVVGTARKLAALMQRKLGGLQLIAVMIDGVRFIGRCRHRTDRRQHVLGLCEGAIETPAAWRSI